MVQGATTPPVEGISTLVKRSKRYSAALRRCGDDSAKKLIRSREESMMNMQQYFGDAEKQADGWLLPSTSRIRKRFLTKSQPEYGRAVLPSGCVLITLLKGFPSSKAGTQK